MIGGIEGQGAPVRISADGALLDAELVVPGRARGLVVFAHGSGSSRQSPRNAFVARHFERQGFATLLFDLLTPTEEARDRLTAAHRFDVPLLSKRLVAALDWAARDVETRLLPIAVYGASTGAAAALVGAAERPDLVRAVVSRGGRPDLAGEALPRVRAPSLFLVGELDETVLRLTHDAVKKMRAPTHLVVVAGATHLFEEPGALVEVAARASSFLLGALSATSFEAFR